MPEYDYSPFHDNGFLAKYKNDSRKRKIEIINNVPMNELIEHYKTNI